MADQTDWTSVELDPTETGVKLIGSSGAPREHPDDYDVALIPWDQVTRIGRALIDLARARGDLS